MNAVAVQYFDERKGFWRVGYLEKSDRSEAHVRNNEEAVGNTEEGWEGNALGLLASPAFVCQ